MAAPELLVYASAYEALQRALGPKLDTQAIARFKQLGIHFDRKLEPAYPLENSVKAVALAAELLTPGAPPPEALEKLGRKITSTFAQTMVGKALFATLRVLGVRRGLTGLKRSLRMNNNYTEVKSRDLAPTEMELWVSRVAFPTYYTGIFSEGLPLVGARNVRVALVSHDAEGATWRIGWDP